MDPDRRYSGWLDTLDRCKHDVLSLYHHRRIWTEVRPALIEASGDDASFLNHYATLYVTAQVVGVRKLADDSKGTASLYRLLTRIAQHPSIVTAGRWVAAATERGADVDDYWRETIEASFAKWARPGSDHVDKRRVLEDRDALRRKADKVRDYPNDVVAHRVDATDEDALTFAELDDAIDFAGLLFRRYSLLLTATSWAHLEPAIQGDLLRPLRRAVFSDGDAHAQRELVLSDDDLDWQEPEPTARPPTA